MSLGGSPTTDTQEESTEEEQETILEVRDINVRFSMPRGQAWVLNDVELDIYRDEILAVAGESGTGKSMFASSLLDAVEDPGQLSGEVTYYPESSEQVNTEELTSFDESSDDSIDVLELSQGELNSFRWEEIAMVFQGAMSSFNPTMKIEGHFRETIRAHDAVMSERMEHVRNLFDALHLDYERVMDAYPHELSGGMKQRALIALALVLEPDMLVMDEPTAALDLLMQRSIIAMLRELRDAFDLTILFITHDLPLIAGLADRIAVMYAFEFIEIGQKKPLLEDAAHPYTRMLLRSLPSIDSDIEEMETIEGSPPDPVNIPTGCSYRPRCPLADDRCEIEDPDLVQVEEDHEAACFYHEQSSNEIKYTLHGGVGDRQ